MEEHISPITHLVNHYLGPLALALLQALHIPSENPELPIPEPVIMAALVVLLLVILALILKSRLSVEKPGSMQQVAELLITNSMKLGIRDILDDSAGSDARSYVPLIGSITLFILFSNLFSLFPWFSAPTADATVPLACASIIFVFFNWEGIRHHGVFGYLKHFAAGTQWWIAWLIMPVEIISTLARLLSLPVRLFANIFASDMIYAMFVSMLVQATLFSWEKTPIAGIAAGIFALLIPLLFIALHLLVAFVQTIIFTALPASYLGMATAAEEH